MQNKNWHIDEWADEFSAGSCCKPSRMFANYLRLHINQATGVWGALQVLRQGLQEAA